VPPARPTYAHAVPADSPTATVLTERYTAAVDYARNIHAGDTRKSTTVPYLAHVLAVSALALEAGGSENQAIAGLLHDTAEDHGGQQTLDEIRRQFGAEVADLVEGCSDSLTADRNAKEPWWTRKVRYLQKLAAESPEVALVSCADKVHNARAILSDYRQLGEALWTRFNADAGRAGTLWYYQRLTTVLDERLAGTTAGAVALSDELARTVDSLVRAVAANIGSQTMRDDADQTDRQEAHALALLNAG
jgi:GTP pyrophosphokinase